MRVCFVSRETVEQFSLRDGERAADVIFFGFGGVDGVVSYERELKGETAYFEDIALLSKQYQCVVVCACISDTRGIKRKSTVVAERGKILGVSDMLNCLDGEFNPGAGLKTYDTKVGKIGVAVGEDIYFPELLRTLAVCGSEIICCPFGEVDGVENVLLRAAAFSYGVPICLCGDGYSSFSDVDGSLAFSSPHSPVSYDLEQKKEYRLVETRRRGFYKKEKRDF